MASTLARRQPRLHPASEKPPRTTPTRALMTHCWALVDRPAAGGRWFDALRTNIDDVACLPISQGDAWKESDC